MEKQETVLCPDGQTMLPGYFDLICSNVVNPIQTTSVKVSEEVFNKTTLVKLDSCNLLLLFILNGVVG